MSEEQPFVSVVIPTYHDWERLKLCLNALKEQSYPQERFEVIVVDNDPEDKAPELDIPDHWRIIKEPKTGSYAARNRDIVKCCG